MAEKLCKKCGQVRQLSEFHKDKQTKSGYAWACKHCKKARNKAYAQTPEKAAYQARYRAENRTKVLAQRAVNEEIRTGRMATATSCECVDCRKTAEVLHHHSYLEQHWLDVVPLCRSCHFTRHSSPELFQ